MVNVVVLWLLRCPGHSPYAAATSGGYCGEASHDNRDNSSAAATPASSSAAARGTYHTSGETEANFTAQCEARFLVA